LTKCPYCGSDDVYYRQDQPDGEEYRCRDCDAVFIVPRPGHWPARSFNPKKEPEP
jgi:transposase-like protein